MPKKDRQKDIKHTSTDSTSSRRVNSTSTTQRFSRTKTGCYTCRSRRKKCDESRDPHSGACGRCRNSGIECLGFPPLKSAPPSAYRKQSAALAKHDLVLQLSPPQDSSPSLGLIADSLLPFDPIVSSRQHINVELQQSKTDRDGQEEGVARWADLMALDDGEQLFYEGIFFDTSLRDISLDKTGQTTMASSRAISADLGQTISTEVEEEGEEISMAHHIDEDIQQIESNKKEDRALTCLSNFYAMFCWYRWQPIRRGYTKDQLALAVKKRLQRSEVLCISVASVAACYGFSQFVIMPENSIGRSFIKHWDSIYHVVTSTKTRNLCAFLEWLGETSSSGIAGPKHIATAQTMRRTSSSQQDDLQGQSQRDVLFSLASRVLQEIALAANQDQEMPTNRSSPLDTAALVHVDKYLHAAMDLATFAFASRSSQAFTVQFDSATLLLNSLLGKSQCVKLSDLQGIETIGFRTFAWVDITNAVLTGRSTLLHYLSDEEALLLGGGTSSRDNKMHDEVVHQEESEEEEEEEEKEMDTTRANVASTNKDGSLQICFGCPDDVLVLVASIANLHFQLLHARKTGALHGQGSESLPAWAVHSALQIISHLATSQQEADARQDPDIRRDKRTCSKTEHYSLGTMWRHAATILLHTTVYRQGPLSATNQENLCAILSIYSKGTLRPMTIAMGDPAMPMLLASFVAVSSQDRKTCMDALRQIGQNELARDQYRRFVQKLWKTSNDSGYGVNWFDLIEEEDKLVIM